MRDRLRNETANLHAAVDARFGPLIGVGFAAYCQFLTDSATAIIPLERALGAANVHRILPDWMARARSAALLADLADLGGEPHAQHFPSAVPAMSGEAFQFGVLYVLEGSRLGAKILVRNAKQDGDPRICSATRYLTHGEGEAFWRTYLERLEASDAVKQAPEEAVAGARMAFAMFGVASSAVASRGGSRERPEIRHAE